MLQLGNNVRIKIDTEKCRPPPCGHTPSHHRFHGQTGILEKDDSQHSQGCTNRIASVLKCKTCEVDTPNTTHVLGICFNGEHRWFSYDEVEDLGPQPHKSAEEALDAALENLVSSMISV